jgi:phosphatidylserine decarboxylase
LPRKGISRAFGKIAASEPPRALLARAIDAYVRAYNVDLDECVIPPEGFRTFNEFFSRPLRAGAREISADPSAIVSPADGRLEDEGPIGDDASFLVKGRRYTVAEMLGSEADADEMRGGRFAIVYLSPRDYHRVHAPVTGKVTRARHIGGTLYPVNRIGLDHVEKLFATNERVCVRQESERFGPVVTVLVGALIVGGIEVSFDPSIHSNQGRARGEVLYANPMNVERGAELGRFLLGSTAIVFLPRRAMQGLVSKTPTGVSVKMGQALYGAPV